LKDYAKIVLHAYPFLRTVEKDYEEHVRNKALLSYRGRQTAEGLAEYLAQEIIRARNLVWLRTSMERVFARLNEEERALTALHYFRKKGAMKAYFERVGQKPWTDGKFARRKAKLAKKLEAMLRFEGVNEDVYEALFSQLSLFQKIKRYLEKETEKKAPDGAFVGGRCAVN
jgi:hypothetical protein